eukprot:TRINITY_DN80552_c0_g1_i1.p2 TRINITY_DN80552_c0_g1~~TRINITY_DN80552_c0_g1_i1.p2  ORF type:complete len:127 (+),score=14.54 TRINITY_DN80552_c0_g1_i1:23-382(+)
MVTNKATEINPDAEVLKERGMLVYTCNDTIAVDMVAELSPDVVLVNPDVPSAGITKAYHKLLRHFRIPVIYTLAEDEQYLVNIRNKANKMVKLVTDNIVDSIRNSLNIPAAKSYRANMA